MKANAKTAATLRSLAAGRGVRIGCAVGRAFWSDERYRELLARECNVIVAENVMKWGLIHPERERYDWGPADELVAFARAHRMRMRGHTFVWHRQAPPWLEKGTFGRDEFFGILREHVTALAVRYQGVVAEWDVVNEALDDNGGFLRNSFWSRACGQDFIDAAFSYAHEADPDALLFYNDYGIEYECVKQERLFELLRGMIARGVPIHGVGLQCHFETGKVPVEGMRRVIGRIAKLGLKAAITELDIRIARPTGAQELAQQAKEYAALTRVFLEFSGSCDCQLTWGITDRYSWVPVFFEGFDDALLFDREYRPKPAADAVATEFAHRA